VERGKGKGGEKTTNGKKKKKKGVRGVASFRFDPRAFRLKLGWGGKGKKGGKEKKRKELGEKKRRRKPM